MECNIEAIEISLCDDCTYDDANKKVVLCLKHQNVVEEIIKQKETTKKLRGGGY